ncbi:transmembrane protein 243 isoform X1 [Myiozetetes cayanensis]|uniref:transmembrane protein 243 isoform X1 n=1 Tax=Myiozetetes cayanensis TaxID=478635 RepID=UPI00215FB692|nr:transmembrane protein 243 isoform X1 [Myiozetetes cayanensis]
MSGTSARPPAAAGAAPPAPWRDSPPAGTAPAAPTTARSSGRPRPGIINLVVGGLTTLLLVVTLISAFVFPQLPPKPVNVFFAFCISLCCISAGILIYWYRQGDLEPKFRNLIYYILFSIVMLCICANLYFHEVDK